MKTGDDRTGYRKYLGHRNVPGANSEAAEAGRDAARSYRGEGQDRESVVAREKSRYGGVKVGSAFFGWLTATGMALLLTALLGAAGAALALATGVEIDVGQVTEQPARPPETIGIGGGIALAVVLFLAYYCGGYVAGRMARFNGAAQGLMVWAWAILAAVAVAVLGAVAGNQYDVFARLGSLPRIPLNEGELTTGGIVTLLAATVVTLIGAVLGGLAGMRYHRKVDRVGLGD